MREPVRERHRQIPRSAVLAGRVRGGDEPHPLTEVQTPDPMLLDHPHQRALGRGGRGVDLVEEHQRHAVVRGDPVGPLGRHVGDGLAAAHRQSAEVGRVVHGGVHGLQRPARLDCESLDGGGLAGARIAPQKHRNTRRQQHLQRRKSVVLGRHRRIGHHCPAPAPTSISTTRGDAAPMIHVVASSRVPPLACVAHGRERVVSCVACTGPGGVRSGHRCHGRDP